MSKFDIGVGEEFPVKESETAAPDHGQDHRGHCCGRHGHRHVHGGEADFRAHRDFVQQIVHRNFVRTILIVAVAAAMVATVKMALGDRK